MHSENNVESEINIRELILNIPLISPSVTAKEYIHVNDNLEIEKVTVNKIAIIKQIYPFYNFGDSNSESGNKSNIEIKKNFLFCCLGKI